VCKEPPYKVEESGYAGFIMPIEVYFKNKKKKKKKKCIEGSALYLVLLGGRVFITPATFNQLRENNSDLETPIPVLQRGSVMVLPEGVEPASRPSPDYPMLPTIPLSAFSDPKKTKPSHGSKMYNRHTHIYIHHHILCGYNLVKTNPHISMVTTTIATASCSSHRLFILETFKTWEKGSPSRTKKALKHTDAGSCSSHSAPTPCPVAPPTNQCPAEEGGAKIPCWIVCRARKSKSCTIPASQIPLRVESNISGEASSQGRRLATGERRHQQSWGPRKGREVFIYGLSESWRLPGFAESLPSSPSNSSSSSDSSSDSDFEPSQNHSQDSAGPLRSMVEDLQSEESDDDDSSSEDESPGKGNQSRDTRLNISDSDSNTSDDSSPPSQEPPVTQKLTTPNNKVSGRKSPEPCTKSEKILKKGSYDKAYTDELVELHRRLMALRERNILQQIVNLIEETGHFNVTNTTFDFDLFSLDESTVRKLQSYLEAVAT
uniref:MLLT1 super elongation complex subunit n=1 Tax=Latimeria chalumnae TaxID=7897 RepID=H3AU33_LATCH